MKDLNIVELLRQNGYGVVEGKEAVLAKIDELSKTKTRQDIPRDVSDSLGEG